jgi:hypothetical protein
MKSDLSKKLITCIVPHGRALPVLKALKEEYGIITANIYRARGSGRMTPLAWRGVGETTEKDVMSVVVEDDKSDQIFEFIFEQAGINHAHGGILYQQTLRCSTDFTLPEIPEEE